MKFIPNAIARKVAEQGFLVSKHSPSILFWGGCAGMVGSTILACRATLKLNDTVDVVAKDLYIAKKVAEDESVTKSEFKRDIAVAYAHGVGSVIKLYGPSVVLGIGSISALTKSHNIQRDRNAALTAAYIALDKAFNRYRERVIDTYGEEADRNFRYESEEIDIIDEETGKVVSTTRVIGTSGAPYARFYAEWSSGNWSPDPEINMLFLRNQQNWLNDRLRARGHVFLNEVYDNLGLSHTKEGAIVGWRWRKESGDDFIDFGIWDGANERVNDFFNGREGEILLDFNVDGPIFDKIDDDRRVIEYRPESPYE